MWVQATWNLKLNFPKGYLFNIVSLLDLNKNRNIWFGLSLGYIALSEPSKLPQ